MGSPEGVDWVLTRSDEEWRTCRKTPMRQPRRVRGRKREVVRRSVGACARQGKTWGNHGLHWLAIRLNTEWPASAVCLAQWGAVVLYIDFILLLMTAIALICSIRVAAPKPFHDPPHDVLICCAHSDDCVITGAEYACGTIRNGLSVRVVYLTCSAPHPDSEIAKIRKAEALAAWSQLDVPEDNFTFIDLSESPVRGPLSYSDKGLANAEENLKTLIRSLPKVQR